MYRSNTVLKHNLGKHILFNFGGKNLAPTNGDNLTLTERKVNCYTNIKFQYKQWISLHNMHGNRKLQLSVPF